MIAFINKNISNINGSSDGDATINFKRDFIMSNEDEVLLKEIEDKIFKDVEEYEPQNVDGEVDEWFTFTTNSNENSIKELTIVGNSIKVIVNNSVTVYSED